MLELVVKRLSGMVIMENCLVGFSSNVSQLLTSLTHPGVSQGALTYQGTCTGMELASFDADSFGLQPPSNRQSKLSFVILNR